MNNQKYNNENDYVRDSIFIKSKDDIQGCNLESNLRFNKSFNYNVLHLMKLLIITCF